MKKTRTDLPFWAKVVFETPELLAEIMFAFRNSVTSWLKDIHARSRWRARSKLYWSPSNLNGYYRIRKSQ